VQVGFADLFSRDALILNYPISEADTPLLPIISLPQSDPYELWMRLPYIAAKMVGYKAFRGDLTVTVRMSVPALTTGLYVLQAVCEGGPKQAAAEADSIARDVVWNSCQDTFVLLNAELSNTAELRLPFVFPTNFINPSDVVLHPPRCWRLQMFALSPLQSTTALTVNGTIDIYARCEPGYSLCNLVYEGKKPTTKEFPVAEESSKRGGGKVSGIAGKLAAGITAVGSAVPFIAPFAAPAAAAFGLLGDVASIFGFTRDPHMVPPVPYVQRPFSGLMTVDSLDTSESVGLFASNALTVDPRVGGGEGADVASCVSLFERWTLIDIIPIPDTAPVGMCSIPRTPVAPGVCGQTLGTLYPTVAGFVGLPFSVWYGDMEFLIYVVSGPTVRGRLVITWEPRVATTAAYTTNPIHRVVNTSIDLAGSSATLLRVSPSSEVTSYINSYADSTDTSWSSTNCNGQLNYYLESPVVTTKTTGFTVNVMVFARGGDNMKFGLPGPMVAFQGTNQYLHNVVLEGSNTQMDDSVKVNEPEFMGGSASFPVVDALWGESFMSVRALMQRFSNIFNGVSEASWVRQQMFFNHYPLVPARLSLYLAPNFSYTNVTLSSTGALVNQMPFTWFGYYAAMFTGVRCSMRMKLLSTGDTATQFLAFAGRGYYSTAPATTTWVANDVVWGLNTFDGDVQTTSISNGAEWCFPAYSSTVSYHNPRTMTGRNAVSGSQKYWQEFPPLDYVFPRIGDSDGSSYLGFVAAGPDLGITRFRRCPGISFAVPEA